MRTALLVLLVVNQLTHEFGPVRNAAASGLAPTRSRFVERQSEDGISPSEPH